MYLRFIKEGRAVVFPTETGGGVARATADAKKEGCSTCPKDMYCLPTVDIEPQPSGARRTRHIHDYADASVEAVPQKEYSGPAISPANKWQQSI
jgi:hypothetical protein